MWLAMMCSLESSRKEFFQKLRGDLQLYKNKRIDSFKLKRRDEFVLQFILLSDHEQLLLRCKTKRDSITNVTARFANT
jgi:hypothetical protein